MADEQRFQTGFIEAESDLPGLVRELDGTVWLVNPDGSRTKLPGGGGSGGLVFQQDTDPGAVGAGNFWLNTSLSVGQPSDSLPMYVRNTGNTGWIAQGLAYYTSGQIRSFVTVGPTGVVAEVFTAEGSPVGGLAIYGDGVPGNDATVLRQGNTYLHFQSDQCYFNLVDGQPFWVQGPGGPTWGIADPSGAEKFYAISPPDDGEIVNGTREHWYDDTVDAPALRFKQKDSAGTLTVGKSVGITDDGVLKLENLPTADPSVSNQIWAADGVLTLSGFVPGGGFTGWTEDASDPANVSTNGGGLNLGTGLISDTAAVYTFGFSGLLGDDFTDFVQVGVGLLVVGSDAGAENAETYSMRVGHGVQSNPAAGQAAFKALALAGATVGLDAGGLIVENFGTLVPTTPPNLPAIPLPQDIADALVTLGLVTQT